jgi:hypothetical protein
MVPLCHWGQQSLKDMTSLWTDFETHAIWQGYVEDPAAKDFVARNAHTIALSEAQGTQQSTLITSLEIPWGFLTHPVLCTLAGLKSRKKCQFEDFCE